MSSAFVSDNSSYLSVCIYVQVACLFLGGSSSSHGVAMVLATGLAAFYGGMLDLLRVFYVLTACIIPLDLYQLIWGGLSALQVFVVILALVARGAACWFGYQVHAEHDSDAPQGGGQFRDGGDSFIPDDGEGV